MIMKNTEITTPSASALYPIGRNRGVSPAPTAALTRMPAAIESPSETMNVVPAHESAIWCAASGAAPSQPITIAAPVNAPLSKNNLPEVGSPSFSISLTRTPDNGAHHDRGQATRVAGSRRNHSKITPTAITREINVASPAPARPPARAPRRPQTEPQRGPPA